MAALLALSRPPKLQSPYRSAEKQNAPAARPRQPPTSRQTRKFLYILLLGELFLFLSAVVLLIDIRNIDFPPGSLSVKRAIEELRKDSRIIAEIPPHTHFRDESGNSLDLHAKPNTFLLLKSLIDNGYVENPIDWKNVFSIGIYTANVPIGSSAYGLQIVYLGFYPHASDSIPTIGLVSDLYYWNLQQRDHTLNNVSLMLLIVGFIITIIGTCSHAIHG